METLWCAKCKREHGSLDLGIILLRDDTTDAEQIYVVQGDTGVQELALSLKESEETQGLVSNWAITEAVGLCQ